MSKIIIIGGGAAGMFASVFAAMHGAEVHLFEQNEKLGKKVYITGKGRCNFTNACSMEELFDNIITNRKFLYSAFYGYNNYDVIDFFESIGVKTKVERGNRVFPKSDHASDIILALERKMKSLDVKIHLKSKVNKLSIEEQRITGVVLENQVKITGDSVFIATGGLSYPTTGATGDGYRFAKEAGHTVTHLRPSLVPMETKEPYIVKLQGLSLRNVSLSIYEQGEKRFEEFGEMLFTHFGVTGPLILSASGIVGDVLERKKLNAYIDLKPALSHEQLDMRILREFDAAPNQQFKNAVKGLLPSKLLSVVLDQRIIDPEFKVHDITREKRQEFAAYLKAFPFTVTKLRDYKEAVITKGGVAVSEINPKNMESKKIAGLYFLGEVLDLDGFTGGFNLQIAWSTAYAAANGISNTEEKR